MSRKPRVFISFSWEDESHNEWVRGLAEQLRNHGVDADLDRWAVRLGDNVTDFMARIEKVDVVLLVCTPAYKKKFDERAEKATGVGYEARLITADISRGRHDRYVPLLRSGEPDSAIPLVLASCFWPDMRGTSVPAHHYRALLARIFNDPSERPPLGERPTFLSSSTETTFRISESSDVDNGEMLAPRPAASHANYEVSVTLNVRLEGDKVMVGAKLASAGNQELWRPKPVSASPFWALRDAAGALAGSEASRLEKGAALVEAIFGDAPAQAELMQRIDPRLLREEASVLTRPVDLWIESYDEALLEIPWRLLAWDGDWLEGYARWSMSVTKLGLRRLPQTDYPRPSPIVLVIPQGAEQAEAHYQRLEARLLEVEPTLKDGGYLRRVEVQSELGPVLREVGPAIVYVYCQGEMADEGELQLRPGLSLKGLSEVLAPAFRTLRLVYVNACWPAAPPGGWGRRLSTMAPYVFVNPGAATTQQSFASLRTRGEAVLMDVVKGMPPERALGRLSGGIDDDEPAAGVQPPIDRINPALWRRSHAWVTAVAPVEAPVPFEKLKTWLDRLRQRDPIYARVSKLAEEGAPAGAKILSFVFVGAEDDHPELLGDGLCAEQRGRFSSRVDLIELDVEGLPMEEGFKARAQVLARLQSVLGALNEGELRDCMTDRRQPDLPAVFWMNWGCYPQRGRPYTPIEIAKWLSGLREALAPHLPAGTYAVSTIGCGVERGQHEAMRKDLRAAMRKARLNDGVHRVEVLDVLRPVEFDDLIALLAEHARSFHATDERIREDIANAILGDDDEVPYGRAIEMLKVVYDDGPSAVILE